MRPLAALATKDLRLLLRDKSGFFFAIVFPLIIAVGFGAMFGDGGEGPGRVAIAVVDRDDTESSRQFVRLLEQSAALDAERAPLSAAESDVRRGRLAAYVVIPDGFGASRERTFWGEPATLRLGVDPSRDAEIGMLEGILSRYLYDDVQAMFTNPARAREELEASREALGASAPPAVGHFFDELHGFLTAAEGLPAMEDGGGWEAGRIERVAITGDLDEPPSGFAVSFPQAMAWALMLSAMSFALGLVAERHGGTLLRLRMAPISPRMILAGKAAACLVLSVAVLSGLSAFGALVFGVRPGSVALLALAVLASSVCFVGIMMLLAVLGRTEKSASGMASAVMIVLMMIGGGMIPLFIMPAWLESVSVVSPVRWAILALEGGTWRAFGAAEMALPVGVLLAVGAASFFVGTRLFRAY